MKTKTAPKQATKAKLEAAPPLAPPRVSLETSACPYTPEPDDIAIELMANPNKVDIMQPSLLGTAMFGQTAISLAFWLSRTRDNLRNYYSAAIHDALKKKTAWADGKKTIEPMHKLKFYEFRKSHVFDPDFATPEPFIEAGMSWWGSMWVVLPENLENFEAIQYFLVFSHRPFKPALSEQARETAADGVARLLERRKDLDSTAFARSQKAKREALLDAGHDDDGIPGLD